MAASIREDGRRPGVVHHVRRRRNVEIQFSQQSGKCQTRIAFNHDSRMRAQSAIPGRARQAVTVELLTGLLDAIQGFSRGLQQHYMVRLT
jgi:hypothetical protein